METLLDSVHTCKPNLFIKRWLPQLVVKQALAGFESQLVKVAHVGVRIAHALNIESGRLG